MREKELYTAGDAAKSRRIHRIHSYVALLVLLVISTLAACRAGTKTAASAGPTPEQELNDEVASVNDELKQKRFEDAYRRLQSLFYRGTAPSTQLARPWFALAVHYARQGDERAEECAHAAKRNDPKYPGPRWLLVTIDWAQLRHRNSDRDLKWLDEEIALTSGANPTPRTEEIREAAIKKRDEIARELEKRLEQRQLEEQNSNARREKRAQQESARDAYLERIAQHTLNDNGVACTAIDFARLGMKLEGTDDPAADAKFDEAFDNRFKYKGPVATGVFMQLLLSCEVQGSDKKPFPYRDIQLAWGDQRFSIDNAGQHAIGDYTVPKIEVPLDDSSATAYITPKTLPYNLQIVPGSELYVVMIYDVPEEAAKDPKLRLVLGKAEVVRVGFDEGTPAQ